ncbi:Zn-ribbon domain-containing OB-fold protein [Streptomyces sp. enrichment culture]|uniref:Zn-ribbon domain-containing OB-fold protein n=1 Tax=Streptomyces sp. enrichment culture TaxID=1795815 RepID=UPI003F55E5BF
MTGRFDVPESDAFTRTYWSAAAEGRLLIRRCRACGRAHHYPREFCPHCWSEDVAWETASGRATLYTWSVVHRNDLPPFTDRTPYVAAVVDLAEGPRMMTEIVRAEADPAGSDPVGSDPFGSDPFGGAGPELSAGAALEVAFRQGIPVFRVAPPPAREPGRRRG